MGDTGTRSPLLRLSMELAFGSVLGFVGAILGGPALIARWYEPLSKDAFSCAGTVREALHEFVIAELVCAAVGGAALATLLFFVRRFFRGRRAASGTIQPS